METTATRQQRSAAELGPLESGVMEVLWSHGASNVRMVAQRLPRPLAYTTVMTTLDRLYKKGLLMREKQERAFIYSPR
ncbi:MAG TPA: BlaI/MecI/CopY family transcriptional regulator, partial [Terriglobales bacterium]|nr:BlaI/MecI/CopY family transcriptional regulator [Terriglobales bacterium]